MTHHYCSYFDHRYLVRGVAMIRSLRRFDTRAVIWVLCLDDTCYDWLSRLAEPGVELIKMGALERADSDLAACKSNRTLLEYYFTCTPALVRHVLAQSRRGDIVTYLDGDLFFYSDPRSLFEALNGASVSIIPHRFPDRLKSQERYGVYNVGWLSFRHDERGLAVVHWWRERCIEWCYDIVEEDRFADQKYLDRFSCLFEGVVVLQQPGANLAPWNLARHKLGRSRGQLNVDDQPLIFFHFRGVKRVNRHLYLARHYPFGAPFNFLVRKQIYRPYIEALNKIAIEVQDFASIEKPTLKRNTSTKNKIRERLLSKLRAPTQDLLSCLLGQFILIVGRRAI
jgi:hypothetical protein